jgi:acyl dehydratase
MSASSNEPPHGSHIVGPHPSGGYILDELVVGMSAEKRLLVTEDRIVRFAEASDDFNPLHTNEAFASRTAYRGRIAHGLLSASFGSAVVGTILPGAGVICLSQSLRFHRPVRIGDRVLARVTLTAIDRAVAQAVLRFDVSAGNELVMDGAATIRVPRRRQGSRALQAAAGSDRLHPTPWAGPNA